MYKTIRLLLVAIFMVALMAPPVGSQSRKITLEDVTADLINLQSYVKEMQKSSDTKNAEMKSLLEQVLSRFGAIDSSVHGLGGSLATIKATDEKSARDLESAKLDLTNIKESLVALRNLDETLNNMKIQLAGLKKQIDDLQNTPTTSGPSAREIFNSAYLEVQQGFYELAIGDLKEFLNTYPKDSRAPMAQLLIGNAYAANKDYAQAVIAYDQTIQNYPESDKKCTALYKKGETHVQLKQTTEAAAAFTTVVKECSGTDEAPLASAALKKLPAARPR